jgi:hypothetical protein
VFPGDSATGAGSVTRSGMAGDNLSIVLFFLTCTVAFGVEAVKAETTIRRASFAALAVSCLLTGSLWVQLKTAWPALSRQIERVATNPVSWFAIVMFLLAVFAFHRPKQNTRIDNRIAPEPNALAAIGTTFVKAPKTPSPADIAFKTIGDREVLENALDYLFWLRKSTASINAEKLLAPYIGKWIRVSGKIRDIRDVFVAIDVKGDAFINNQVFVWFDENWRDRFHMLDRNMDISVIGKIDRINSSDIEIKSSELAQDP